MNPDKNPIKYSDAGVDVHRGYDVVSRIKSHVNRTKRGGMIGGIGGFGGLFAPDLTKYPDPVLVSGTDGVGTKLKIAFMMDKHDTIGIDAVAMCVNDIAVVGAEPLYFLDYIASGRIKPEMVEQIISGIADGCVQAGCALIGGETAEMPGFYPDGEYDVAGFSTGIVNRDAMIDGSAIKDGDILIGVASSGIHSNGYSLVRKVFFERLGYKLDKHIDELGRTLGEELITPTRIYVKAVQELLKANLKPSGIAHITGGGFIENIPRFLTEPVYDINIKKGSWEVLPIFSLIQKLGPVEEMEMYNTYNMGIGLVIATPQDKVDATLNNLKGSGYTASVMGHISKGTGQVVIK